VGHVGVQWMSKTLAAYSDCQPLFIVLSDINECQMFSNLCVYGRCVNIFGMFRCECDEGYALDGSGGEYINGLEYFTFCIIQYSDTWLCLSCTLRIEFFQDILHRWQTYTYNMKITTFMFLSEHCWEAMNSGSGFCV